MDMLRAVLDEWCVENAVPVSSDAAAQQAGALIDWFQFGIQDRSRLKAMLSPMEIALA